MAKTREIKKRIKAVGNIRRITKTMQMIATAKFSAAQGRVIASKPYTETIFELVTDLAASLEDVSHPLLSGPGDKGAAAPELTLVLTSDRGLCGPYNGAVLRTAMQLFRSTPSAKAGQIELVGKKGAGALKFNRIPVAKHHTQFGDKPAYEAVEALAQDYIERFIKGEIKLVRVVYTRFLSAGRQAPTVLQLLPFEAPTASKAGPSAKAEKSGGVNQVYEFSPDAASLLGDLLPAAIKAVLFQVFQDAVVSEHVARMIAMKAATDNAGKMSKRLTRTYNRARQAQITTELTEIISGAAALE
ncbi:MAG: ATP synthase F1 subunit gamma [Phycisphaerales bacterium]|nr:ATP synthase F1 subunit gamma [Phycisphaerales bacterium]